ncbi:MAG: hypothetical protein IMZ52_01100 [Actinobacteria bacterium]|nr:hypothetical protein [Actinomycetota bacterium]MBE3114735.1 hypothetical protein [Actinomycetota bacterium]
MKEKEWKLKPVIITNAGSVHLEGTNDRAFYNTDEDNEKYGNYYRKHDIEILRQKLINDIHKYGNPMGLADKLEEDINKRFGYE